MNQMLENRNFGLDDHKQLADSQNEIKLLHLSRLNATEELIDKFSGEDQFGPFLAYLMELGFAPEVLANELTTSTTNISRWRNAKSKPPSYSRANMVRNLLEMVERWYLAYKK